MRIGTKSLLFGIHQIFWHPFVVYRAWCYLYGRPTYKELICIFIHDWGYWGKPDLDGSEGILHPRHGAYLAHKWFGFEYWKLCACHSRSYILKMSIGISGLEPSRLCWADKMSFIFEPRWFYLLRAQLSGELKEARLLSVKTAQCPLTASNKEWYKTMIEYFKNSIPSEILNTSRKLHGL